MTVVRTHLPNYLGQILDARVLHARDLGVLHGRVLWMAGLATGFGVPASPVLPVWGVMLDHGKVGCREHNALTGPG